jgi:hypothetical protein
MAILGYKTFEDYNSAMFNREFGLAEWLRTHGLAGWLEIATDGLEASAKQRIANEIEVHYSEAVKDQMAAGEPELSAQTTALLQLGDPQAAALNFQKSHLTESEARSMKSMEWIAAKPFCSFWALPLDIMPLLGFVLLCVYPHRIFQSRLLAIAMLVAYAGFRLIPRLLCAKPLPRKSFIKVLALSTFLTSVALGGWNALLFYTTTHDIYIGGFFGLYIVVLQTFKSHSPLRIWNKLRKMGDERNELPPRQATSI